MHTKRTNPKAETNRTMEQSLAMFVKEVSVWHNHAQSLRNGLGILPCTITELVPTDLQMTCKAT